MMIKLDTNSTSLTYPDNPYTDVESARRLIVLVPADADYTAVTQRIWELAHALACRVLFLSLCSDAAEESSLRRQLITMAAMVEDGKVCAETRVGMGSNWVHALRSELQDGDIVACFAEHHTGLLHRPLSQILQANLDVPVYILSGLSANDLSRPNLIPQILGWAGSIGIIAGTFLLQIRILSLSENWAQTTLLILSVLGEIWFLWGWNQLVS